MSDIVNILLAAAIGSLIYIVQAGIIPGLRQAAQQAEE